MPKPRKTCDDGNSEKALIELIKVNLRDQESRLITAFNAFSQSNQQRFEQIMTALETLTASVNANTQGQADLTTAVNAAIVQLGTPGATDAQLLSLASAVDASTQSDAALTVALKAAVNPPVPTP